MSDDLRERTQNPRLARNDSVRSSSQTAGAGGGEVQLSLFPQFDVYSPAVIELWDGVGSWILNGYYAIRWPLPWPVPLSRTKKVQCPGTAFIPLAV